MVTALVPVMTALVSRAGTASRDDDMPDSVRNHVIVHAIIRKEGEIVGTFETRCGVSACPGLFAMRRASPEGEIAAEEIGRGGACRVVVTVHIHRDDDEHGAAVYVLE